jgi:hypothetical protein
MVSNSLELEFVPDCVFIPETEGDPEAKGYDPDPKACTLLKLDGDNIHGECYTQEEWENKKTSFCSREHGKFTSVEGGHVELLPDLWVVKIQEREYWNDDIKRRTDAIFGVYVFDRRQHVHCCSFEATYECYFLGSQYRPVGLTEEQEDELNQDIMEGDAQCEEVSYWGSHDVDRMLENKCWEGLLPANDNESGGFKLSGIRSVTTKTAIEEALEAYQRSEF